MGNKFFIQTLFLLFFCAAALAAQGFMVTYAEGRVELQSGAAWKRVVNGAILPESSVVRVGADGLIEVSSQGRVVTIYSSGTYVLKDLVKPAGPKSRKSLSSVDAGIRRMAGVGAKTKQLTSAAAVRGAGKDATSGPDFSDPDNPLPKGQGLIQAGKYKEAVAYFENVLKGKHDPDYNPPIYYFLAFASAEYNQRPQALKYADKIAVDATDPLFGDLVLLKARLYLQALAYDKALETARIYLKEAPYGEHAPAVHLLCASAYEGKEDAKLRKEQLEMAVARDPDLESDAGKEAAALLKEIQ